MWKFTGSVKNIIELLHHHLIGRDHQSWTLWHPFYGYVFFFHRRINICFLSLICQIPLFHFLRCLYWVFTGLLLQPVGRLSTMVRLRYKTVAQQIYQLSASLQSDFFLKTKKWLLQAKAGVRLNDRLLLSHWNPLPQCIPAGYCTFSETELTDVPESETWAALWFLKDRCVIVIFFQNGLSPRKLHFCTLSVGFRFQKGFFHIS